MSLVQLQPAGIQRVGMYHKRAAAATPLGLIMRVLRHRIEDATRGAELQLAARHSVMWRPNSAPLQDLSASCFHAVVGQQQPA